MINEDEVMSLLERADPARGGNAAPTVDAARYLDALGTRSSNLTSIETTTTSARPTSRHHWLMVTTAAAALAAIVAGSLLLAARDDPITQVPSAHPVEPPATEPALPPPLPEEFTVCIPSNSATQTGRDNVWEVPSPDGDVVIEQGTGTTVRGTATSSDPRFEGTHYYTEVGAEYNYEGGGQADESGPEITAGTHRIENDEGAWQGSSLWLSIPDDTPQDGRTESNGPVVLIGEGAYEGLTAVLAWVEGSCVVNLQGYVMEVPAPPVPYTGE